MNRFIWGASLVILCGALEAAAQHPVPSPTRKPADKQSEADQNHVPLSLGTLAPTPEMWFYDQAMRQYQDPHLQVRQKAEFEMAQRQRRLAAQRWFGISNSRPSAETTPMTGTYAPSWVSNTQNPMQWAGQGGSAQLYQSARPRAVIW
jgi:hypothetical protein